MAEIKSTLDLIMERTKNLTMTDEEKKALKKKELEGKIRGWVQKFLDGLIDINHLKSDIKTESVESPELPKILKMELLKNLQAARDNNKIFKLFEEVLHADTQPLQDIITSFNRDMETEGSKRKETLEGNLRGKKIHGSSVIPNLNRDDYFQKLLQRRNADLRNKLMSVRI